MKPRIEQGTSVSVGTALFWASSLLRIFRGSICRDDALLLGPENVRFVDSSVVHR